MAPTEGPLRRLLNRITSDTDQPGAPPAQSSLVARPVPPGTPPPRGRRTPSPPAPVTEHHTPPAGPAGGPPDQGVRFSVRPARSEEDRPPVTEAPSAPVADAPVPAVEWRTAGRFPAGHRALAAVDALHRAGAAEWSCHAEPGGGAVWLLSTLGPALGAELLTLHGAESWRVLPHGALAAPRGTHPGGGPQGLADVISWPRLGPVDLLTRLPPTTPGRRARPSLSVLTTARLQPSVVRQALAFGVEVSVVPVRMRDLATGTGERQTLLLVLSSPEAVPHALVVALSALPRTAVCRSVAGCERLLLDVRLRPGVDDALLHSPVPDGEWWLAGDRTEWPPLRLEALGPPSPAPAELVGPAAEPAGAEVPHRLPDGVLRAPATPVRLVPDAAAGTAVDAVLLDDDELPRLRRYLPGRPLGEVAFLLPGPGHHLLLEPAGLARDLPFGVPLHRIGPGGCFVESGHLLAPPLPPTARARLFGLDDSCAVVCWTGGRHRFPLAPMVPAWTLWAPGDRIEVSEGLSRAGQELLDALESLVGSGRAARAPDGPTGLDTGEALERAVRLRALGDKEGAAEAFRAAGDLLEAARLYEEAALDLPEEP
ncbi:hypothetical protein AB0L35_15750 [Streptomyces sp. NPDC052309]|uniref:hypothetical protein n=1 Tax=Streptomyces sp. NPDC052309 TaxID=3155421 RepID=UPI003445D92F